MNDNVSENYSKLDKSIKAFYDKGNSSVRYLSLFEALDNYVESDMISLKEQELYWRDTDHYFSRFGEIFFGEKVIKKLGKDLDLIPNKQSQE